MTPTFVTLWQNPDGNGNMQARARMLVGQQVYDETVSIPISTATDTDLRTAISNRIAELQAGTTDPGQSRFVNAATAEQIVTPLSEVKL